MDEMKDPVASPKLERDGISFSVFSTNFLLQIKLAMWRRDVDIFLELISKNSIMLKRNIFPSQELGSVSCLSPYGIEEDSRPWGLLMF